MFLEIVCCSWIFHLIVRYKSTVINQHFSCMQGVRVSCFVRNVSFYFLIITWLIIFEMLTNTVLSCISGMIIHVISYWLQTYCICFKKYFCKCNNFILRTKKEKLTQESKLNQILINNSKQHTQTSKKKPTYLCTFMYIMISIIYLLIMKENSVRWIRKKSRGKKTNFAYFPLILFALRFSLDTNNTCI